MDRTLSLIAGLLCVLIAHPAITAPLPYQAGDKHLGVASCASSVCHGAVKPNDKYNVQLNEYVTWSRHDAHARAYQTLLSKESKAIAAKLGLTNAHTAKLCLDCHTDNVAKQQQGEEFHITDGIGCEACHGGGENWIESHSSKDVTYAENVRRGMYPTAELTARATLCLSCHYGNNDKFATHRIMGAGHPRLSFELDTFQALQPPHYRIDSDYRDRKSDYQSTKVWALSQLAATKAQLEMLRGPLIQQAGLFPEIALFDCHACHNNSMGHLNWQRRLTTRYSEPGNITINDGHLRMVIIIANQVDKATANEILALSQALQKASGKSRKRIIDISQQLTSLVSQIHKFTVAENFSETDKKQMLGNLIQAGIDGEYRDYIGAEQAVMAIELVMIDMGMAETFHDHLNSLYTSLKDDESYRPARFIRALELIKTDLK